MNIYSKTLGKDVELEIYSVEAESGEKTIVTSNSLLALFNSMSEVKRDFPVQHMSKDYCYARCVVSMGDMTYDNDGDCNADFEDGIDKNHIGMTASRRAFDRAFLDLLNLDIPDARVYSSSEGIKGRKVFKSSKAKTEAKPESVEDTKFTIGDSSEVELELTDEEVPVMESEAEPLPEEISLSVEEMVSDEDANSADTEMPVTESVISLEEASAHAIVCECAQQGKTLQELYNSGKKKFLENILRYADDNEDMKADAPYIKVFLEAMAA